MVPEPAPAPITAARIPDAPRVAPAKATKAGGKRGAKTEAAAAKPAAKPVAAPKPSAPAPAPVAAKTPEPAKPKGKVNVPATAHVRIDVPPALQQDLDKDPRMQPWVNQVMAVIDRCHNESAKGGALAGTIEVLVTMHENERPSADIKQLPPQLSPIVACATGGLMRTKMPLFTGNEGARNLVRIQFK
jgi:hypothetical protein